MLQAKQFQNVALKHVGILALTRLLTHECLDGSRNSVHAELESWVSLFRADHVTLQVVVLLGRLHVKSRCFLLFDTQHTVLVNETLVMSTYNSEENIAFFYGDGLKSLKGFCQVAFVEGVEVKNNPDRLSQMYENVVHAH